MTFFYFFIFLLMSPFLYAEETTNTTDLPYKPDYQNKDSNQEIIIDESLFTTPGKGGKTKKTIPVTKPIPYITSYSPEGKGAKDPDF